jgi:hypothetical protein
LTDDAIKTVMEGVKSLGIQVDSDATRDALLQEARSVLCKLNSQYEFLLTMLFSSISRSEKVDSDLVDSIRKKNQLMHDVLSISRHVLEIVIDKPKEGFLNTRFEPMREYKEGFEDLNTVVASREEALKSEHYMELKGRGLEITEEKNRYANHMLGLYGFLNMVALGFIFYIVSSN